MAAPSYQHSRSTLGRYKPRGTYEYGAIHSIVNSASILHVSFVPNPTEDPFPTILPMIGHMGSFADPTADPTAGPLDLYIHGHSASRLMKLPSGEGLPVCVAATHIDGIVLALTPFNHSCNYRSAVLHGYAEIVTDEDEKMFALQLITDGLVPGRWENSRVPPTKTEMTSTTVLRVRVVSASAKVRAAGPGADDRKDLKDENVSGKVWTGVVPMWQQYGEAVEGPKNLVKILPGYLDGWIKEKNRTGEHYATEVAGKKY